VKLDATWAAPGFETAALNGSRYSTRVHARVQDWVASHMALCFGLFRPDTRWIQVRWPVETGLQYLAERFGRLD